VTWFDIVIISVIGFSALLAFMRGLVREVLGLGSWFAAGLIAVWAFPYVRGQFHSWVSQPDVADVAALGVVFLAALLVLSVASGVISGIVRSSMLGGIDRTLGLTFGLVRGAGVLVFAYILAGSLLPIDAWPAPVRQARLLPYVYEGALFAAKLLPPEYHLVVPIPPGGREMKAAEFLRLNPQGRAVASP
jgi:membrane protein required for colicin V production